MADLTGAEPMTILNTIELTVKTDIITPPLVTQKPSFYHNIPSWAPEISFSSHNANVFCPPLNVLKGFLTVLTLFKNSKSPLRLKALCLVSGFARASVYVCARVCSHVHVCVWNCVCRCVCVETRGWYQLSSVTLHLVFEVGSLT